MFLTAVAPLRAQECRLSGRVVDAETSRPLAGVSVAVKGSNTGAATDSRGGYALRVERGRQVLVVSSLGYRTEERTLEAAGEALRENFALEPEQLAIDEVVVTGTGTEHYLKSAPVQTEVIGSEALKSYSGSSFSDILSGLSPSFDFSQSDMGAGISLGGLGNGYVLILVDGKRLHGDLGGQNDLGLIDPNDIQRIEIVKGASSSLYGSDAIAGVVNVITRKHRDVPFLAENTTRIGSHFDLQQHNTVAFKAGKFSSETKFSLQHTDGWQNSAQELYRDVIYDNTATQTVSAYTNERIGQQFSFAPNSEWNIALTGMYYRKLLQHRPGLPRWRSFNPLYHDQSYALSVGYRPSERVQLSLDGSWDSHVYFYEYYHKYVDEYYRLQEMPDGSVVRVPIHPVYFPGDRSTESDQRRWTVQAKGIFELDAENRLSAGVEWMRDALVAPHRMKTERASSSTVAAYVQEEWSPAKFFNLTAGVRAVWHEQFGWTATPKLSLLFKAGGWNFRATASRGFKAPTIKELYYFYERTMMGKMRLYFGNEKLDAQTSNYLSAGVEYRGRRFTASVTASYNRVKDMIALVSVPVPAEFVSDEGSEYDGAMRYVNMEHATVKSLEFVFSWRPGAGFSLGGGYTYTDARATLFDEEASEKTGTTVLERRIIDGTAEHRGNLRVGWKRDWKKYGLGITLFGRGQTERFYKEYGNAPGYTLWRLTTTHRIGDWKHWTLEASVGVDNLFDHVERHPYGYNYGTTSPGRTIFGSVTVRFGRGMEPAGTGRSYKKRK